MHARSREPAAKSAAKCASCFARGRESVLRSQRFFSHPLMTRSAHHAGQQNQDRDRNSFVGAGRSRAGAAELYSFRISEAIRAGILVATVR